MFQKSIQSHDSEFYETILPYIDQMPDFSTSRDHEKNEERKTG